MAGIAPVRQSDRLVEFTAKARARRYFGGDTLARNLTYPMALASIRRVLVCRIERENSSAFCLRRNVATGTSDVGTFETCRLH